MDPGRSGRKASSAKDLLLMLPLDLYAFFVTLMAFTLPFNMELSVNLLRLFIKGAESNPYPLGIILMFNLHSSF
jgi:hypothetical protein